MYSSRWPYGEGRQHPSPYLTEEEGQRLPPLTGGAGWPPRRAPGLRGGASEPKDRSEPGGHASPPHSLARPLCVLFLQWQSSPRLNDLAQGHRLAH